MLKRGRRVLSKELAKTAGINIAAMNRAKIIKGMKKLAGLD